MRYPSCCACRKSPYAGCNSGGSYPSSLGCFVSPLQSCDRHSFSFDKFSFQRRGGGGDNRRRRRRVQSGRRPPRFAHSHAKPSQSLFLSRVAREPAPPMGPFVAADASFAFFVDTRARCSTGSSSNARIIASLPISKMECTHWLHVDDFVGLVLVGQSRRGLLQHRQHL